MFSGIVEATGTVVDIIRNDANIDLKIRCPFTQELKIDQSVAHNGADAVRYWMHNNMITINGKKMGKSLGNFITLDEFFTGSHPLLEQAYSPMTIRFFILQAHYRGTVDFSNEALQGAEKALGRMLDGYRRLRDLTPSADTPQHDIEAISRQCYEALDDDFNTPMVIAALFEACRIVNQINDGKAKASAEDLEALRKLFDTFSVSYTHLTLPTNSRV